MHRQILTSSAVVVTAASAAMASAMIWLLLTRPTDAVALSNGNVARFFADVLGVIVEALRQIFQHL
jgi:hypothetical protein